MNDNTTINDINAERVDTENATDKKCPCCGATLDYDPAVKKMHCAFCDYTGEIEDDNAKAEELDFLSEANRANKDWGVKKKIVVCKSCGAKSVYDLLEISNICPYCGSNQVTEIEDDEDMLTPGGVCPFVVSDKDAGSRFTSWLKKKIFCPSKAKKMAKPDAFKGVYLPYWTFDTDTDSDFSCRYGIDHTYKDSKGNTHTRTDWHSYSGSYSKFINDQLVIATARQNMSIIKKIEPFDTENNKSYKPEYISGFIAEKYSIGLDDAWTSAKKSINNILESDIESNVKSEHNADRVDSLSVSTTFSNIKYKYLLLPVWLSSFKYKEKIYQFMVNGQTGKVGGKSPISPLRVTVAILLGLAIIAIIAMFSNNS